MSPYIFGLISYFGWGTGDIFGTYATRKVGAYITTFWAFALSALVFSLYLPWALDDASKITLPILVINILIGSLYVIGNITFNEALRRSSAPVIGTIGGSFSALTVVFSYIFLNESLTPLKTIFTIIIFIGVYITTTNSGQTKDQLLTKGVLLAIISSVFWAIYFTFNKILISQIGWFWPNYIPLLLFPVIAIFMKWKKESLVIPKGKVAGALLLNALTLRGGDFAFNIGASLGFTASLAPIAGAYPTLFAVLSYLIFRDPLNKKQIIGIGIALSGLVALGFVGV